MPARRRWRPYLSDGVGASRVRVVRPETLALARWTHRIDGRGTATTRVAFGNGLTIEDGEIRVVFNRIQHLPAPRFERASAKNRDYARAELQGLVASWLYQLGDRVVHSMRRHPLVSPSLSHQRWTAAAVAAGLPIAVRSFAASDRSPIRAAVSTSAGRGGDSGSVLVAGDSVIGSHAGRFGPRCVVAARALDAAIVEFRFATTAGTDALVDVDLMPALTDRAAVLLTARLLERSSHAPGPS